MSIRLSYLFVLLFVWNLNLHAQQKDFVTLTGISVTKNLSRAWDVSLGSQAMFYQNSSELWIAFGDASIGYRINKNFNTELHYRRIAFRTLQNTYDNRNLFYHTISFAKSSGKFSLLIRNRLQQLVYGEHFDDRYKGPKWYNREKITLKYRLNYYLAPFVSVELFQPLNNPARKGLDQYRAAIGISYNYSDYLRLEPYYQLQQQVHRTGNNSFYVLGINALIKIP